MMKLTLTFTSGFILMLAAPNLTLSVEDPCTGRGTSLLVLTASHELRQCENGRTARLRRVALGTGGVGKTRSGDRKTPLGLYRLGTPRPSKHFGRFIPFDYPTAVQQKQGYTGSDLGVHGPKRGAPDIENFDLVDDWTWGCVAVQTDAVMLAIEQWIRENGVQTIELV